MVGQPYTFTFTVTGTPVANSTVTAGTLPPGLALSGAGDLVDTPTQAGMYTFTVTVTAANGVNPDADIEVTVEITDTPCTGSVCFSSSGSSGS